MSCRILFVFHLIVSCHFKCCIFNIVSYFLFIIYFIIVFYFHVCIYQVILSFYRIFYHHIVLIFVFYYYYFCLFFYLRPNSAHFAGPPASSKLAWSCSQEPCMALHSLRFQQPRDMSASHSLHLRSGYFTKLHLPRFLLALFLEPLLHLVSAAVSSLAPFFQLPCRRDPSSALFTHAPAVSAAYHELLQ